LINRKNIFVFHIEMWKRKKDQITLKTGGS